MNKKLSLQLFCGLPKWKPRLQNFKACLLCHWFSREFILSKSLLPLATIVPDKFVFDNSLKNNFSFYY